MLVRCGKVILSSAIGPTELADTSFRIFEVNVEHKLNVKDEPGPQFRYVQWKFTALTVNINPLTEFAIIVFAKCLGEHE